MVYHYRGSGSGIDNCISCGNDSDGWRSRKKEKKIKTIYKFSLLTYLK